ncbi:MAG: TonB-dependent receptor [Acidobacteria bacterium]|nr:TonB-dependent receptor [Acidobacteriota bacterium]
MPLWPVGVRCALAAVVCAAAAAPVFAQPGARPHPAALASLASAPQASVHGIVLDDRGRPLAGAVVTALGATTSFAVSDEGGRFAFQNLPFGPYLVRAHLQGYLPPRARLVQVNRVSLTVSSIALTQQGEGGDALSVLEAGLGGAEVNGPAAEDEGDNHDHGEVAWRLRHLKRSVLKSAATGFIDYAGDSLLGDSLAGLGWAVGTPARVASILADVPWNGQLDLLTTTSFDRPRDLLSPQAWLPRGVAFLSLEAPTPGGQYDVRGAVTRGDRASWILAGSYRRAPAPHRYEAGFSYGVQQYLRAAPDARSAVSEAGAPIAPRAMGSDGGRTVGALHAYDEWTMTPRLAVSYGAKYARYDYLAEGGLFSPRAAVTVAPTADEAFTIRADASRRAIAPGAEEFIPPSSRLWLPPERTFSSISPRRGFTSERVDHVELAAERTWAGALVIGVRAFRQRIDEQIVTLFGITSPGSGRAGLGHYYVASAGDLDARGWGVGVSRTMAERLRASVDYTQVRSAWLGPAPDAAALAVVAPAILRDDRRRVHDVTASVDATLPFTATRVVALYRVNSHFAGADTAEPRFGARFDVQLNQALPFLNGTGGQWEMLVAVRSLFREDLVDASVYDELLVVRPPKRVVGGVTVKF